MKLSQQINMLKSTWMISCVNIELKTNTSDISSTSIIRVNVVYDHTSHIPVCQTHASSYWRTMVLIPFWHLMLVHKAKVVIRKFSKFKAKTLMFESRLRNIFCTLSLENLTCTSLIYLLQLLSIEFCLTYMNF